MREFKLFTHDKSKFIDITDKFTFASEPKGLGISLNNSFHEDARGKRLLHTSPSFEPISFNFIFSIRGNPYTNYKKLASFIASSGKKNMLLEYKVGEDIKYCEVRLKSMPKSEISKEGIFSEVVTFERLTYWFNEEIYQLGTIRENAQFPLEIPTIFGSGATPQSVVKISNAFYEDIPTVITIVGPMGDGEGVWTLALTQTDSDPYDAISLIKGEVPIEFGETLIIDAAVGKVKFGWFDGEATNFREGYQLLDKRNDSFLYLPQGDNYVWLNGGTEDESNGLITILVRKYKLD